MGQALIDSFSHRALIHGVQTGSDFAQRHAEQKATGGDALAVARALQPLFPQSGFERGRIYGIAGDAAMSLLFALAAEPTTQGSWWALVDMPRAGLLSASEHGVALQRTLCVSSGSSRAWPHVVGALVDGIDLVAVMSPSCSAAEARRIAARVRAQGSVLLVVGRHGAFNVDAVLTARSMRWQFDTHASSRTVRVATHGRRVHGAYSVTACLPSSQGNVSEVMSAETALRG
jgi:hypothetical protein